MKYMFLVYYDEQVLEGLGVAKEAQIEKACLQHMEKLNEKGQFLGANRLHSVSMATCVRSQAGKSLVTDGPFAETREQLAGYCLLEAENLDEAIEIATHMPQGQLGTIEIRPVMEFGEKEKELEG